MLAARTARLDNGLTVVAVEQPHLHSTDVSLLVKCGSRHEAPGEWGLSHLVEHMLFRGSAGFPTSRALAHAFERAGGTLQASTWRDHTHLSLSIHPSHLARALAVLADTIQRPLFGDLEVERSIVEQELRDELDDDGHDTHIDNVSRASIWSGHPMGRRIAGSLETLSSFSREDVVTHHQRHYVGDNVVLSVAGRVAAQEVVDQAAEAFQSLKRGRRTSDGEAARFAPGGRLECRHAEGSQLEVQLTFEAAPEGHDDFAALALLSRILDDGVGSRLQQAICARAGLVYRLTTGLDCYADCGLYDIEMRVAPRRAASAIACALETLATLCDSGVEEDELAVARERALHELEFSIDSADDLTRDYGSAALFGLPLTLEEQAARLKAVGAGDLLRVGRAMFTAGRIHTTLMGPVERANLKRIEALIDQFAGRSQLG